jgi:predicted MFS family arabinose efflux permease
MVLAPFLLVQRLSRFGVASILMSGMGFMIVGDVATAFAPILVAALGAQIVTGAGNGLENVGNDTMIQQAVRREMLGRAGGALEDVTSPRTSSPDRG